MRVLICDDLAQEGIDILKEEFDVDIKTKLSEDELVEIIPNYAAIVVRSATKVTKKVIENSNLKVIGRAGVGVDNIDVDTATQKGILVVNAPEGNTIAASEHTIALLMAAARNIPAAVMSLKNKKWDRKKFMGVELRGKTLGVVGLGRIGKDVAIKAIGLGMNVIAYDPYVIKEHVENINVKVADLETVLKEADFLTFHVPVTKSTYHMIDKERINMMKDRVIIINCARGGIIDEAALYEGLVSGKIAACALDVFEQEPPLDSPLIDLPNVIATPHLGASTAEAQINVAVDVAKDIIRALKGEMVKNPVNMISIRPEEYKEIKPFMELAEKMGSIYTQLKNGRISEVEMIYSGKVGKFDVRPITTAGIKGILTNILQIPANVVNAYFLAKERGIKIIEKKVSKDQDAPGTVILKITTDKGVGSITGTVFGKDEQRIVAVDEYKIDLIPEGFALMSFHRDRPGIVGEVGTLLGQNDINIAYMQLGRKSYRGEALMVLGVDEEIPESVLNKIRQIKDIADAVFIKF
ncbi:phosphoglycerate dehydrogenase [Tepidanaerobacter sp. GT38]|uniref:phosphoglycerate dehydrogenase n=1 Tax=Tepidanaerobacter sp. GT38 TaxID=2722793 RepID=UPI001F015D7A|nr:phosphoglycerate dehydrogenase [Tepidanaerobacter sp. GT38]MCG1012913.1 phosphoglycerate dehydrogenase [Tepidanaerobacter sp. GT38]